MNSRQVDLQAIIRNLENKILLQKQQNKILAERFDQRFHLLEQDCVRKIYQKDRMIEYLTQQLDKDRQIIMNEQYLYDSRRVKEKEEVYRQYERCKQKNNELQKKLQSMMEKYELEKKDLENQIKKYQERQYDESFSRASFETEIQKLNKFYHQSRVDQPKRKELVQWTEKLTTLINKAQTQNSKTLQDLYLYVKNNIQAFKQQLIHSFNNASDFQDQVLKNKKQILNQIKQLIREQSRTKEQIIESNQKLFDALKKQKSNSQLQKIQQLQKELTQNKKKSSDNNQELANRIKSLETERKTLLLGFTQLKTLNQTRQKSYKEQIQALKETISQLLQNSQKRQYEFEKQMKILHNQLTSISQRYYENIQVPLSKITSKLDNEVKSARVQLQKLSQNRLFIKSIQNLEQIIQNYIIEHASTKQLNIDIIQYIHKSKQLIYWSQQVCQQLNSKPIEKKEEPRQNMNGLHKKITAIESNIKQVEWKERENKLLYQLTTAKKYNKKLKQYCDNLQAKSTDKSPIKKGRVASSNSKSGSLPTENAPKIYQLQAEIEKLNLLNKSYSQQYLYQLSLMKQAVQTLTGKQVKDENNLILIQKGVKQISQFNFKLETYVEKQSNHITSSREILYNINRMFLKPVEIFDNFIEKLTNCYQTPSLSPTKIDKQAQAESFLKVFSRLQQLYKQMNSKRQQNNIQTNKLFAEFIRMLRETTPNHQKNIKLLPVEHQREHLQKSRVGKQSVVEKRIKDLHNVRMKSRQQIIKRLQRIEESLRNIEAKYSKRHFININRVEESIAKKIDEFRQKCIEKVKENSSEINQITGTVLKDIKNKLKLCMNQNEGLVRQVELLQKYKKKQ